MLVIEPTADGRLRIQNNHRADFARDEMAARTLAYNWGHTDISINKALSAMRAGSRGEAEPSGWRVTPRLEMASPVAERGAALPKQTRTRSRAAPSSAALGTTPAPASGGTARKPKRTARRSIEPPAMPRVPRTALAPVAKSGRVAKRAEISARPAEAASTVSPATKGNKARTEAPPTVSTSPKAEKRRTEAPPAAGTRTDRKADPRERALAHFRAGVDDLMEIESSTLAFARGPWSDLREMAEYVAACLEGKRPKAGWAREGK